MNAYYGLEKQVAQAFFGQINELYPYQEEAIHHILKGDNVILSASTGAGKTEAAVAPLLSRYFTEAHNQDTPILLYIAPTKALVNDLYQRLSQRLQRLGLQAGVRHGDTDDLKRNIRPTILITTPESLDVLLFRKDKSLYGLYAVVVDEVHLFYDTQRGLQLSILLQRLEKFVAHSLQYACLSATIGVSDDIHTFIFGTRCLTTTIRGELNRVLKSHLRILRSEDELRDLVARLLSGKTASGGIKLLMFANSRRECERLASVLKSDARLTDCVFTHYSSLSPEVREQVEHDFARLSSAVCIATSTLELGIDIGDIEAVILYGPPSSVESLLQRIGRSNRRTNQTNVIALVPENSVASLREAILFVTLLELARHGKLSYRKPYQLYGAVAQQLLSQIGSSNESYVRVADLSVSTAHLAHVSRAIIEVILANLSHQQVIRAHTVQRRYGAADGLFRLIDYRLIYGNFPLSSRELPVMQGKKLLGHVPIDNLLKFTVGDVVRFAGNSWRIVKLSRDLMQVEPAGAAPAEDLVFYGAAPGISPWLIDEMWRFIHAPVLDTDSIHPAALASLEKTFHEIQQSCTVEQIPMYFADADHACYLTFAGKRINTALALFWGIPLFRATDFALTLPRSIFWKPPETEKSLYERVIGSHISDFEDKSEKTLYQQYLPAELQNQEMLQQWKQDTAIDIILSRLAQSPVQQVDFSTFSLFAS